MDVGFALDREMMTVGHEVAEVRAHVQEQFRQRPQLAVRYPTMLEELQGLLTHPDYDSLHDYHIFIRGYFYGYEQGSVSSGVAPIVNTAPLAERSDYKPRPKPWWRFW